MTGTNRYTLFVLASVFAMAQLDRQILNVTLDAIGTEFSLSNTQLGLLSGFVFVVVFVGFGFPIATIAARGNRRNIVASSLAVWSLCTLLMGGAQNFIQLIAARLGVGAGEAGAVAPAHSMIADLYPPKSRTSALATFATGANVGALLALLIGGIAAQALGWRWAFVIAALPGFIVALLLRFTTQEPTRIQTDQPSDSFWSLFIKTACVIFKDQGLRYAFLAFCITGIVTAGAIAWAPTFLIRYHEMSQAQVGIFLALTVGVGGGLGTFFSGRLLDYLGAKNPQWRLRTVAILIIITKIFVCLFLLVDDTKIALLIWIPALILGNVFWAPTFAYIYSKLPSEMRPMGTAIFLFGLNLVGFGIGPALVGIMSDTIFVSFADRALSTSLLAVQSAGLLGAFFYWKTARTIAVSQN